MRVRKKKLLSGDSFETFWGFGVLGSVDGRGDPNRRVLRRVSQNGLQEGASAAFGESTKEEGRGSNKKPLPWGVGIITQIHSPTIIVV